MTSSMLRVSAYFGMTLATVAAMGAATLVHGSAAQESFAVREAATRTGFNVAFASRPNCPIYYGCPVPPPAPPTGGGGGGGKGGEPQAPKLVASDDHPDCRIFDDRCTNNPEPPDRNDRDGSDRDREHRRGHDRS
ncbi:MAG: hypothetical protein NVSMB3_15160 [Acidobacteriaceae bacterium]